jgi:hypothetical protein
MEKDILNENELLKRLNENKNPLSMEDYTGDNAPLKCFNIDKNEYGIAREDEEFFASIDDDTVILSIKDDERLFMKGDFNALEAFSFIYHLNHLTDDSELFVISNNDFDNNIFSELINSVSPKDIYYDEVKDEDFEYCINVTKDSIRISDGKGLVKEKELPIKEQSKER